MNVLDALKAQLRPLLGAVVHDGDLFILPTDGPENLFDTDTVLYLSTTAGPVAFALQSDGQTPLVEHPPGNRLHLLPSLSRQAGLAQRHQAWQGHYAANDEDVLDYERFALAGLPELSRAMYNRLEQVLVYAFADDNAPTGIKLVFPNVVIHSVAGAAGNVVRSGDIGNYFSFPVLEHMV